MAGISNNDMRIADLHHRFGAFLIDWHIRTIPLALWGFWIFFLWFPAYFQRAGRGLASLDFAWQSLQPILARSDIGITGWLAFAAYLAYHPLLEWIMQGESPGKRMMGVTVRRLDGSTPDTRQVLMRNLWRAIEFLPFAYAWGVLAIVRSPENVRTGDTRTGTRVVMR